MADLPDDELFKIVAYLVSSAALVPEETFALASFRLLQAASMLIAALQAGSTGESDACLGDVAQQLQAHFNEVMLDEDSFLAWTRQLCVQLTREARARNKRPADDAAMGAGIDQARGDREASPAGDT
jgi:hypothetical protein